MQSAAINLDEYEETDFEYALSLASDALESSRCMEKVKRNEKAPGNSQTIAESITSIVRANVDSEMEIDCAIEEITALIKSHPGEVLTVEKFTKDHLFSNPDVAPTGIPAKEHVSALLDSFIEYLDNESEVRVFEERAVQILEELIKASAQNRENANRLIPFIESHCKEYRVVERASHEMSESFDAEHEKAPKELFSAVFNTIKKQNEWNGNAQKFCTDLIKGVKEGANSQGSAEVFAEAFIHELQPEPQQESVQKAMRKAFGL